MVQKRQLQIDLLEYYCTAWELSFGSDFLQNADRPTFCSRN